MLHIDDLHVAYGPSPALDGVSFSVRPGTITAVVGRNGSGKSTLLRTISGLVQPWRGQVLLAGTDLSRRPPEEVARAGVAHVPQGEGVIDRLTVEENLRLGALRHGRRVERAAALQEAYELFPPLGDRRRRLASTLPGSKRQMLMLARALMARPRVLLLDEPTIGLNPWMTCQTMELLGTLRDGGRLAILLVEQRVHSALSVSDHGIVLHLGRVAAAGDAASLASDTALQRHCLGG